MSMLHALWMDGIDFTRCPIHDDEEFHKLSKIQCKRIDRLMETLTTEQRKMVLEIEREENALRAMIEESTFVQSFKWGARMMLEVLSEA